MARIFDGLALNGNDRRTQAFAHRSLGHEAIWLCLQDGRSMPDFTAANHFSAVTYTTTGYGELVLPAECRLVGGVEALTGILMGGHSTGMFFAVFSRIFRLYE